MDRLTSSGLVDYIELRLQEWRLHHPIDAVLLGSMKISSVYVDAIGDSLIQASLRVYCEKERTETVTLQVRYPATWWDHMKRDLLPIWITKWLKPIRWISEDRRHTFSVARCYPDIAPREPARYMVRLASPPMRYLGDYSG